MPGGRVVNQLALPGQPVRLHKTIEQVHTDDGQILRVVRKRPVDGSRASVALVHGIAQNRYSYHMPRQSFTAWLAGLGFETWNIELRGHGRSRIRKKYPGSADDYFQRDFPAVIRRMRHEFDGPVFAIGHSLGGATVYAGATYVADLLDGIVPMAPVYSFGGRNPAFRGLGAAFRAAPSPGPFNRVPLPVHVVGAGLGAALPFMDGEHMAVSPINIWHPGTMERKSLRWRMNKGFTWVSAGVVRHLLMMAGKGFVSVDGTVDYAARFRRLGTMPLLVIAGSRDTLLPPSDAKTGYLESPAKDKQFVVIGPEHGGRHWGHVDLVQGDRAPKYVWPVIGDWLAERS